MPRNLSGDRKRDTKGLIEIAEKGKEVILHNLSTNERVLGIFYVKSLTKKPLDSVNHTNAGYFFKRAGCDEEIRLTRKQMWLESDNGELPLIKYMEIK